jgi:hypothetical protein
MSEATGDHCRQSSQAKPAQWKAVPDPVPDRGQLVDSERLVQETTPVRGIVHVLDPRQGVGEPDTWSGAIILGRGACCKTCIGNSTGNELIA